MPTTLSKKIATLLLEEKTTIVSVEKLLTRYHLKALLPSILASLHSLKRRSSSYNTIVIESPFPVADASVARIKRIVGNDMAPHTVTINKDVLAGFTATFRGVRYDGSAKRSIKQLLSHY